MCVFFTGLPPGGGGGTESEAGLTGGGGGGVAAPSTGFSAGEDGVTVAVFTAGELVGATTGGAVCVFGPAGVGGTTLVGELGEALAGVTGLADFLTGWGSESGPFEPMPFPGVLISPGFVDVGVD